MADGWLNTDLDNPVDKTHEMLWLSTTWSVFSKLFILA